jgi:hypothetical protein
MNEIEYLDSVDGKLQAIFDLAVAARDEAQAALAAVRALKGDLLRRKLELQREELARREERLGDGLHT